jgi:hypothetical protein
LYLSCSLSCFVCLNFIFVVVFEHGDCHVSGSESTILKLSEQLTCARTKLDFLLQYIEVFNSCQHTVDKFYWATHGSYPTQLQPQPTLLLEDLEALKDISQQQHPEPQHATAPTQVQSQSISHLGESRSQSNLEPAVSPLQLPENAAVPGLYSSPDGDGGFRAISHCKNTSRI